MGVFDRELIQLAGRLTDARVGVVGDMVCDLYIYGRSKRVSREAPVLILEHERESITLGGAANAVNNLAALGAKPLPIGVIGNDEAGRSLLSIFQKKSIETRGLFIDQTRPTTVKKRFLGSGLHTTYQQIMRIDQGSTNPIKEPIESRVLGILDDVTEQCDALVVSDYGYGMFSDAVLARINRIATRKSIPVLVDSRYQLTRFQKPTLISPNEPEAEESVGLQIRNDDDVKRAAQRLSDLTGAESILITRGKRGMFLAQDKDSPRMIPIFGSDEIADVTGAGDTVMAMLTAGIVSGLSLYDSARLATVAAGLVVMKAGTATVTKEEIKRALEDSIDE